MVASDDLVLPSRADPFVRELSSAIGGPLGRHARTDRGRWWTPLRMLLALTMLTMTLGWLQKAPCRTQPWVGHYQYTRLCYSDVYALYTAERLNEQTTPYVDFPVEYPVLLGAIMTGAERAVRPVSEAADRNARFFDVTWALMAAAALVVTLSTALLAGSRRRWDAAMVALAPGLLLHGVTNWDLGAVALAGLGLLAWARGRPGVAGVLLGLGTATKMYPALLLVPLFLLCLRAGRWRAWLRTLVGAASTVSAVYVPAYILAPAFDTTGGVPVRTAPSAWSVLRAGGDLAAAVAALAPQRDGGTNATLRFIELNRARGADWDSLWFALQHLTGSSLDRAGGTLLNFAVAVLFLALLAAIALLVLRAPRRPRVPQIAFLVLAAFLLSNKVYSPQYTLWLIPLAVLARPSWRAFLAWQAAEVVLLAARFYHFVATEPGGRGLPIEWFLRAVAIRDLALILLASLVVRDVLRPDADAVRATGADDPAGGVLDGASDVIAWPARRRGIAESPAPGW